MRADGYRCYNSECKYYWGEICRASANVTLTCIGRIVHKQTNADHIRSMTDEELARFLDDSNSQGCVCPTKDCEATCTQCIENWLKQPYEEETND